MNVRQGQLTLRMESERHFLWRKRVTRWTRLLNVLLGRLGNSLNLSHRLNWNVIFDKTGDQIVRLYAMTLKQQKSIKTTESSTVNPLIHIHLTREEQTLLPALLWALWWGQWFISIWYGLTWIPSRKYGVTPLFVWSNSLSQIISEVRGVRGSHSAEVNCRPDHTQFELHALMMKWSVLSVYHLIKYSNTPNFQLPNWENWLLSIAELVKQNNFNILEKINCAFLKTISSPL